MIEPFVSIIIPVRNEEAFIKRCLTAVLEQDYPSKQIEIIIADGESDDGTRDIIASMPGSDRIKVVNNPRRIQAAGLNVALKHAGGDYVIRIDGHTVVATDYIRQCVTALHTTGAANVGGPMDPVGITPMGKAIAVAGKSTFAVPTAFHVSKQPQYTDTVYLGAWPHSIITQHGGFNENVGVNEDYELNYRIRQAGGKIYFTPAIRSDYYGRQTLSALWRQYFRYGQSKVKTLTAHPASLRPRQLVSPLFVAGIFGGGVVSLLNIWLRRLWIVGLLSYSVLNIYFTFSVIRHTEAVSGWRLALVFATIHIAWGLGFWSALYKKLFN